MGGGGGGFFFFQAEDGIRDLVRSRGLGDVYKRQLTRYSPHQSNFWRNHRRHRFRPNWVNCRTTPPRQRLRGHWFRF